MRTFAAKGPNQAWVIDVTRLATGEDWVCFKAILDLLSRRMVG